MWAANNVKSLSHVMLNGKSNNGSLKVSKNSPKTTNHHG